MPFRRTNPSRCGTNSTIVCSTAHERVERARNALLVGLACLGVVVASGVMLFALMAHGNV